ncbi:MAG: D-amino-acid transaminase [Alphaproteobacteria bacterium]
MHRIAYVNGLYVPHGEARVHIEDRGFQLADGVYELIALKGGRPIDLGPHLDRLGRSLKALRIDWPMERSALKIVLREVVRRNGIGDGIVYIQVTRGVARRDHAFPGTPIRSSLVVTSRRQTLPGDEVFERGVSVVTTPDLRWKRCDIKSVGLLPNVLGKQFARESGAFEAWLVDSSGHVTEGTSSNAWIVTPGGDIVTRQEDWAILNGITRKAVLGLVRGHGMRLVERPFTVVEAKAAPEAFITSTTSFVLPVVRIDGKTVGKGAPGPMTRKLRQAYLVALADGAASW